MSLWHSNTKISTNQSKAWPGRIWTNESGALTSLSGSDRLRLTFYSDYHQERRGFALTFQPVSVSQCGGYYAADSGVLQSPNYPFYYPPNALCIWKIQVKKLDISPL